VPKEPSEILADLASFKSELGSIAADLKSADQVLHALEHNLAEPSQADSPLTSAEEMAAALEELYLQRDTAEGDHDLSRDPADIFSDLRQLKGDLQQLAGELSGLEGLPAEEVTAPFCGSTDGSTEGDVSSSTFAWAAVKMADDLDALYSRSRSAESDALKDPADIFAELEQLKGELASAALDIKSAGSVLRTLEGSSVSHDLGKPGLTLEAVVQGAARHDLSDVFSDLQHFKAELNDLAEHIEHAGSVLKAFQTEEARVRNHIREEWLEEVLEGKAAELADLSGLEGCPDEDVAEEDLVVVLGADGGPRGLGYGGTGPFEGRGWGRRGTAQPYAPRGAVPGAWKLRSGHRLRPRATADTEVEMAPLTEDGNGGIGRVPFVAVSNDGSDPLREVGAAFDTGDRWKERPNDKDATQFTSDLGIAAQEAEAPLPVLRRRRPWETAGGQSLQALAATRRGWARPVAHRTPVPWATRAAAAAPSHPTQGGAEAASSVARPALDLNAGMRTETSRVHQKWVELGVGTLAAASVVATVLSSKVSKRMAARTAARPHLLRNSLRAFWQAAPPQLQALTHRDAPPMWTACAGAVAMAHLAARGAHSPTTLALGSAAVVAAAAAMIAPAPSARGRALSKIGLPFTIRVDEDTSMWVLAQKYYGSGALWRCLGEANPHVSPKTVQAGSLLRVYLPASQPRCPPCSLPPRPRM